MMEELSERIRWANGVENARFLILEGVAPWFCIGGSGKFMEETIALKSAEARQAASAAAQQVILEFLRSRLFTVALIDGLAAGAGADLALAADLILCTERARFSLLYGRLGLIPDAGFMLLEWRMGSRSLLAYAESKILKADDLQSSGIAELVSNPDFDEILHMLRRRIRCSSQNFAIAKALRNDEIFKNIEHYLSHVSAIQAERLTDPDTISRLLHSSNTQRKMSQ